PCFSSCFHCVSFVFFTATSPSDISPLSLHDALPICHTPWGTYLTCEENVHFYFGGDGFEPDARRERYGFSARWTSFHGWSRFDPDRKSTRLNSSHVKISYAVFCLKKKTVMSGKQR